MAHFVLRLETDLSAPELLDAVLDLRAHDELLPLTRVRFSEPVVRQGTRFTGRTGLGPFGFDDPMECTEFVAPTEASGGSARIVKSGRVIRGAVFALATPTPGGALLTWSQEFSTALPAPVDAVLARLLVGPAYRLMLGRFIARAGGRVRGR